MVSLPAEVSRLNRVLVRWAAKKLKRFHRRKRKAFRWLVNVASRVSRATIHGRFGPMRELLPQVKYRLLPGHYRHPDGPPGHLCCVRAGALKLRLPQTESRYVGCVATGERNVPTQHQRVHASSQDWETKDARVAARRLSRQESRLSIGIQNDKIWPLRR